MARAPFMYLDFRGSNPFTSLFFVFFFLSPACRRTVRLPFTLSVLRMCVCVCIFCDHYRSLKRDCMGLFVMHFECM